MATACPAAQENVGLCNLVAPQQALRHVGTVCASALCFSKCLDLHHSWMYNLFLTQVLGIAAGWLDFQLQRSLLHDLPPALRCDNSTSTLLQSPLVHDQCIMLQVAWMMTAAASVAACSDVGVHVKQGAGWFGGRCVARGGVHVQVSAVLAVGTALSRGGGVPGAATGAWSSQPRSVLNSTAVLTSGSCM